jgi:hypothetical protein
MMKIGEKGNINPEDRKIFVIDEAIQTLTIAKQLIEQLQNRRVATGISV